MQKALLTSKHRAPLRFVFLSLMLTLSVLLVACEADAPATPSDEPVDAFALLTEAVNNLREVRSFEMLVEQRGVPYVFGVTLGEGQAGIVAELIRAQAQYIAPDVMYAKPRIRALGAPVEFELFARDTDQWLRAFGSDWQQFVVAEDFNAADLVREGSGFDRALNQLRDLEYVERTTLIDGTAADHVRGFADGQVIYDLLFGLVIIESDDVIVDVYINPDNQMPVQLEVKLPDTATEAIPNDTMWYVELFNFGADPIFTAADGGDL